MSGWHFQVVKESNGQATWALVGPDGQRLASELEPSLASALKSVEAAMDVVASGEVDVVSRAADGSTTPLEGHELDTAEGAERALRAASSRLRALALRAGSQGKPDGTLTGYAAEVDDIHRRFVADRVTHKW